MRCLDRGCECSISANSIHFYLLTRRNGRLKYLKDRSHNEQNRRSGEIASLIFETYDNAVQPHCCHIYSTSTDMTMAKMCPCTCKHHNIPQWKCVLRCCYKCPIIVPSSHEENKDTTNTCPTIIFHVCHNVSRFTVHGRRSYH